MSNPLAIDLVEIAKGVFLADRFERRKLRLGQRRRNLQIKIPVSNIKIWDKVAPQIEDILSFASEDNWKVEFTHRRLSNRKRIQGDAHDVVALFSGGVDSCCGAAHLARANLLPIFVAHSPLGRERSCRLLHKIWTANGRRDFENAGAYVFKLNPDTLVFPDPLRRTRPFYYLSLGLAVALDHGIPKIQMSENGAMALSLPTRADSYGAMRSRQAHRYIREGMARIMDVLESGLAPWTIENPFEWNTKGEACSYLKNCQEFISDMPSCEYINQQSGVIRAWKEKHAREASSWHLGVGPQCGICEPCIFRRAALKKASIYDPDEAYYFNAKHVVQGKTKIEYTTGGNARKRSLRPPLFDHVATHAIWLDRFSRNTLATDRLSLGIKYLPELRMYPYTRLHFSKEFEAHYQLLRRLSRELLNFLE